MGERARMRVVVPDDYNDVYDAAPAVARLRERADVTIHTTMPQSLDEWVERMRDAEIAVANRERIPLGAPLFDRLPKLEMIAQTGGGGSSSRSRGGDGARHPRHRDEGARARPPPN